MWVGALKPEICSTCHKRTERKRGSFSLFKGLISLTSQIIEAFPSPSGGGFFPAQQGISLIISAVFLHLWEKFKTMTEIDRLGRISLRDLKPLFTNLANVREQLLDAIAKNPENTADALATVEKYIRADITYSNNFSRITYKIEGRANEFGEMESLLFKWESDGEQREQRVNLSFTRSNLKGVNAPCYYFVCPYTSRLCRKLYTDGRVLLSRYGFPHTYSARNYSHRWRNAKKVLDFMLFMETESNFTGRRDYYNGKLTRFGRKLRKIAGGEDYEEILARQRGTVEALYFAPRRGRPPKPENERKPRGGREQPPTPTLFTK